MPPTNRKCTRGILFFDRAWSVEPNAGQVSERGVKPLDDPWRQWWTEYRVDVVLDVSLVAGSEENDIDTLLVARVAIRCVRDAFRSPFGDEEPERITVGEDRRVEMTLFDQLGEDVVTIGGLAEQVADDEHQERADPSTPCFWKDPVARSLVHEAVGQHGDFPGGFLDRLPQHSLFRIVGARLGDADMAHLPLFFELDESGRQDVAMMVIGRWSNGVEMEDVHVIEAQPSQRRLHPAGHGFAGIACVEDGLGRDHQPVPVIGPGGSADDLLGAIGLGGVEEIDSQIDGRTHDRHAVVEACAAAEAQAAVAPAPEPGDAYREAGFSEWPIFHNPLLDQRLGPPPGQTGLLARSGQPAGAPEAAMASATEREESHFAATKRMPVTTPPASDARCSMGGAIFSGRINWLRSMDPSSGTIGVSVVAPGTTTK